RSRALVSVCARAIRAVHREEWETAEALLHEAKTAAASLTAGVEAYPALFHAGYTQDALKEYVEAEISYALVRDLPLPTVNGFPDKFKGYVTLNMNYKDSLLDELIRGEDNNLKLGIKLHVYRQKYEMDDEALIPVFQHLNRRKAICLHHYFGPAEKLESLLRAFPDIVFIEGHSLNEYDHLVRKYDNLYINTCAQLGYRRIEEHVRIIGSEKIVYGSDFVALDPSFGFGPVAYAKITDLEKRNILGLNMKRILDRIKD
ncbi:MAG: amidohydrolase family protein, partial [Clostridia bacterium]